MWCWTRQLAMTLITLPLLAAAVPEWAPSVSGRVSLLERSSRSRDNDIGTAVVWLEGDGLSASSPVQAEIATEKKQFLPHVIVVPQGSTVGFPNHDPFNHNVFSPSEPEPFDLGLYPRGETRTVRLARAGVVRVFCNVHAKMSAFVVVRDNRFLAQPGADGSFTIPDVPPGRYTLVAWHERAAPWSRAVEVGPDGLADVVVDLDASGYKYVQHADKTGQSYALRERRY